MILKNNYNIITFRIITRPDKMSSQSGLPPFDVLWKNLHEGVQNSPTDKDLERPTFKFTNCFNCDSSFLAPFNPKQIKHFCGKTCNTQAKFIFIEFFSQQH